jgi:hypothetical protein
VICPDCGGWGFDFEGRDCLKCNGIGELPDVPPEPPVPKPEPPEYDPTDPDSNNDINNADWWKTGDEERPAYEPTKEDDEDKDGEKPQGDV